jgi:hypothetical protein
LIQTAIEWSGREAVREVLPLLIQRPSKLYLNIAARRLSHAMTDCRQMVFLFLLRLVYERTAISANDPDRSTYIESPIGVYIDERKTILMSVN